MVVCLVARAVRVDDGRVGKAQDTPTGGPTMPDPHREVRRAVGHLVRAGLTPNEAASMIVHVTLVVEAQLHAVGIDDVPWVHQLWIAACVMEVGTTPESGREDDTEQQRHARRAARWRAGIEAVGDQQWSEAVAGG
jgi:hypothetical protein